MHIAVAGAGIAGLASAIALARDGHDVEVFEQATQLETVGAGLQLGPNAWRALEDLGAAECVLPVTTSPQRLLVLDAHSGATLSELPLGTEFAARFGAPYRLAHRADLLNALADTARDIGSIDIRLGCRVTGTSAAQGEDGEPARLTLLTGEEIPCDLVIAADGLRSPCRQAINAGASPRTTPETLYRALSIPALVPEDVDATAVCLWFARGGHVVHYPVSGGSRLNIVACLQRPGTENGWNGAASRADVQQAFDNCCETLKAVLAGPASWLSWTGADIEPFTGWSQGPSTLIGDAAHATLPHLAQGAAMALEDAVTLSHALKAHDGVPAALAAFERTRQPRTARVTLGSRRNAHIFQMKGSARLARNLALRWLPPSRQLERLRWLYDWHPPARH